MRVLNGSSRARAAEGRLNRSGAAGPPPDAGRTNSPDPAARWQGWQVCLGGGERAHGQSAPSPAVRGVCGCAAGCPAVGSDFFFSAVFYSCLSSPPVNAAQICVLEVTVTLPHTQFSLREMHVAC